MIDRSALPGRAIPYPAPDQELWDELLQRPSLAFQIVSVATSVEVCSGPGILLGITVLTAALAAGACTLRDGVDVGGPIIAVLSWPAAGDGRFSWGFDGLMFRTGLFFVASTGTLTGAVQVKL